jgi:hypothetical protein
MTHMDLGTTGAKRQSWEKDNPRELLRRLIERHPENSRKRHLAEFKKLIANRESYWNTIVEYWFSNNYSSLIDPPDQEERQSRALEKQAELQTRLEQEIEARVKIALLDMVMPNGKALRECTGKECRHFSSKIGAWLLRVAKQIKPTDRVGDVLTEKQLRKLYGA